MWGILRVVLAIALVLVIVYIVISPYMDLPLTTLRARQLALVAIGLLFASWYVPAVGRLRWSAAATILKNPNTSDSFCPDPLRLTCEFLC